MSSRKSTFETAFPNARVHLPHAGCPRMGSFRRSWVVPHLTKDNWDRSGVLYWDKDDRVVYATVSQFVLRHEPGWQITRYVYQDGRLTHSSDDCFPKLDTARGALNLEAASSETVFGPIPEEEWPEDTQSPWIVFSLPRRAGS